MSAQKVSVGSSQLLDRLKLPAPARAAWARVKPDQQQILVGVVSRVGDSGRTWILLAEGCATPVKLSSTALNRARIAPPAAPAAREQRSARPRELGPFVSDSLLDGEDGESDSMDDSDYSPESVEEEEEEKCAARTAEPLAPHGLRWTPVENAALPHGASLSRMVLHWSAINLQQFGRAATTLHEDAQHRDRRRPVHYFLLAFPVALVHPIVQRTNAAIAAAADRDTQLTTQRFFALVGLLYLMTLTPRSSRREY